MITPQNKTILFKKKNRDLQFAHNYLNKSEVLEQYT